MANLVEILKSNGNTIVGSAGDGRAPNFMGIVLNEDLPAGYESWAILVNDKKYSFIGKRVC